MRTLKAVGERGSWFATVGNDRLPCVHAHWVKGSHHADPGYKSDEPKWVELLDAIQRHKKVILTKDDHFPLPEKKSGLGFERRGYIAVFEIANLETDETGLHFDLTKRLCELR